MFGKNDHVPDAFSDAIGTAVRILRRKEVSETFGGNIGDYAGGEDACTGMFDGLAVDIRREDRHLQFDPLIVHVLAQQDGK